MEATPPGGKRILDRSALPAILFLALFLRLPGHFHPAPFHYDEGMEIDSVVNTFPPGGSLRHPFLNRYLVFAAESVYYGVGRLSGSFSSVSEFGEAFESDPRVFLYVGRSISLIAGLLTVFLTYKLGRRVWNRSVGLGGALLLAVSPGHILVSNNLRHWSVATLLATLTLLLAVRVTTSEGKRIVVLMGLAAGFAVASVYSLGLLLLPVACAIWTRGTKTPAARKALLRGRDAILALSGTVAGFLVGNVGGLVRWAAVSRALSEATSGGTGHPGSGYLQNVYAYAASLSGSFGMGPALAVFVVLGICVAARFRPRGWWVLFSFLVSVFVLQPARLYLWGGRYAIPAYPVLLLHASGALAAGSVFLARRQSSIERVPLLPTTLLLLASLNLVILIPYAGALRRTPTTEQASRWIEETVPAGTGIVVTIRYVSPTFRALPGPGDGKKGERGGRPGYQLVCLPLWTQPTLEEQAEAFRDSVAALARAGYAYVVLTDPVPPAERIRRGEVDFERSVLDREYPLVRRFVYDDVKSLPDDTALVNPEVRIYRLQHPSVET